MPGRTGATGRFVTAPGRRHDGTMRSVLKPLVLLLCLTPPASGQELRGHGGPVRAIAVAPDGASAMTGSFDQSAILWSLSGGTAEAVLRFHEGAVNAVAAVPGLGFATVLMLAVGVYLAFFVAPEDYQQGDTVRIMFIHVPAAYLAMFSYVCLGVASFLSLIYRHALADAAAK
eukprot:gene40925-54190_t